MASGHQTPEAVAYTMRDRIHWFLRGMRAIIGIPVLILASSVSGFAALALDAGLTMGQAVFMTAAIWALPSQLVLIGAIFGGATLPAAALAVALSAVRLTPMVVAILPDLRTQSTRPWVLYLLSHFVAVTAWVIGMQRLRSVPAPMRTSFFFGLGITPILINAPLVAVVYWLAADLPPAASAALLLLTPLYFITSIWGSTRERAGQVAMVVGIVLWPVMNWIWPAFSLVATGLLGGGIAFAWHLWSQPGKAA